MNYVVIVSAVRDRADLLDQTLRSMLAQLDEKPARVIVHEDVRQAVTCPSEPSTARLLDAITEDSNVSTALLTSNPGAGLGRAVLRLLEASESEFVLYTQEDFDFLRPVPVGMSLGIMATHRLNHVRFNKRKTLAVKGAHRPNAAEHWTKQEVAFDGRPLCVSDHWYFQASLWRRSVALEGFRELARVTVPGTMIDRCEMKFNHWFNTTHGAGCGSVDGSQEKRRDLLRTFIWGGVGEPAFIRHTGHDRRSQGWPDPEKRNRDS